MGSKTVTLKKKCCLITIPSQGIKLEDMEFCYNVYFTGLSNLLLLCMYTMYTHLIAGLSSAGTPGTIAYINSV
jgi:hypothetical protein